MIKQERITSSKIRTGFIDKKFILILFIKIIATMDNN